jgi:lamin tail-like protein
MKPAVAVLLIVCIPFLAFSQNRYDVVIDEIMADPSPQVGLPSNEWIELKNITSYPVNLLGWRIADASSQSGPMSNFTLQPDSFVLVCSSGSLAAMSVLGNAISVANFPSLDNDGDQVCLRSVNGNTIHAVEYSSSWYQNQLKKDGGWSLEMIDVNNPCTGGSNWTACVSPGGGTPGGKNSVDAVNRDDLPPQLKYAYTIDSVTVIAMFDEPLDSLAGATPGNYTIDGGLSIVSALPLLPLFKSVQLKLNTTLLINTVYLLTVNNLTDCASNVIASGNKARIGLPEEAFNQNVVINEILFNPKSNGFDYVECFNQSNKIIDASKLFVANRSSTRDIASIKKIFPTPYYIFPGDYFVVTEDEPSLEMNYLVKNPDGVIVLSSFPSYPDDEGDVILLNGQGTVIDEVSYKDDWHFKLIDDREGVSIERIDPAGTSQDPANWHSAASTAGYGTPSYKNSQYKQAHPITATLGITPKTFSPDNDGNDDIATIQYEVSEPGYVANITIYDSQGRAVRYLVKNGILGTNGRWNWDGLDENEKKLPIGIYIVYTEIFNLQGKTQHFKNAVVLARKLN